jgi:ATP-dependent DNA helicase RecG
MSSAADAPTRARRLASLADVPLTALHGVGPRRADALGRLGLHNVADLLWHVPHRYIDRSLQQPIDALESVELGDGEELTVFGEVQRMTQRPIRRKLTLYELTISDGTGTLRASWFNQPGLARRASVGATVAVSGTLKWFKGRAQLEVTAIETVEPAADRSADGAGVAGAAAAAGAEAATDVVGRVVPVHPGSAEVPPSMLRTLLREALERTGTLRDPVPPNLRERHGLTDRTTAFRQVHFPDDMDAARAARDRLAYDELFVLETSLALHRANVIEAAEGYATPADGPVWRAYGDALPFACTAAQRRALDEIAVDLARPVPMHRLLQGDVGAGKTVVAAHTLLAAVDAGGQGALMAPTEVLAEQHHAGLLRDLAEVVVPDDTTLSGTRPVEVALLTNRTTGARREELLADLAAGRVDIVVGTHALIQDAVAIPHLRVVVIDEQHRFGVHQRVALRERGDVDAPAPDVLIMTATPIPRTLAMTVYGDLDVSVLDELPPGRTPVRTVAVPPDAAARADAWCHLRDEVAAGRQAYVVCPLVSESEALEVTSATSEYERLTATDLADLRVGLLHGQLRPSEKQEVMAAFRDGHVDVLVATTVIEVGVDVPNATVMIIEDAERFGLSQLHQLRGRIGRGAAASTCFLFAAPQTDDARARMDAMVATTDGFVLAERDLEIRGEGALMGARQSGRSDLRVARLLRDLAWVEAARHDAFALVAEDRHLTADGHVTLREEVEALVGDDVDWLQRS